MKVSMLFVSGFIVIVLVFGMTILSHAELVDNNDGTITDTDTGLMWLQDANYAKTSGYDDDGLMNWFEAKIWADNLVYAGYDDWRLPSALNTDGTGPCQLDNCTDSEIGHLYYTELGNVANGPLKNSLNSSGDFQNLQSGIYWSGTEYAPMPDYAWHFHFSNGFQSIPNKSMNLYALAVRTTGVLLASISDIPFVSDGAEEKKEIQRVKQQDEIIMDNQYSSQTIYTIQTGSFLKVTQAQKMFDSMPQILNEQEFSFLRIEKIGTYYSVRLGRYDNYNDTEKFLQEITPRLSDAIILNAYIKNERIIKLYE
jgi:hypothetical protein